MPPRREGSPKRSSATSPTYDPVHIVQRTGRPMSSGSSPIGMMQADGWRSRHCRPRHRRAIGASWSCRPAVAASSSGSTGARVQSAGCTIRDEPRLNCGRSRTLRRSRNGKRADDVEQLPVSRRVSLRVASQVRQIVLVDARPGPADIDSPLVGNRQHAGRASPLHELPDAFGGDGLSFAPERLETFAQEIELPRRDGETAACPLRQGVASVKASLASAGHLDIER